MARPLLGFCAIFKNESGNVRATLESVKPFVDRWNVFDTGSTDATMKTVMDVMEGLDGRLRDREPIMCRLKKRNIDVFDFAANRNSVLNEVDQILDHRPIFTLFLSGDEILIGGGKLREFLEAHRDDTDGAYSIRIQSGSRAFGYTRVLRVDAKWRYKGVIHEVPASPEGERAAIDIPGVMIVHAPTDPERKVSRIRDSDLLVLEEMVDDESLSLGEREDAIRMLGETHALIAAHIKDKAEKNEPGPETAWLTHQMTAMSLYQRYTLMAAKHDPEMSNYVLALYYSLAEAIPGMYSHEELVQRLTMFTAAVPDSPEAHYVLAKHASYIDARLGLMHAVKAAKVAREAMDKPRRASLEMTLQWRSLVMASACADQLARDAKDLNDKVVKAAQAKKLMAAAVSVGAPKRLLEEMK